MLKNVFKVFLFIISFFIIANNVDANSCDYVEISRLKNVASNIDFTYSYVYDSNLDDVKFTITIQNIEENIIITDINKGSVVYNYNGNSSLVLNDYDDGRRYQFEINTDTTDCLNKKLLTRYIELPKYNKYYNDEVCFSVSSYYMCQMWYQHELTKEQFYEKINIYKESLKNEDNNPSEDKNPIDSIVDILIDNYYYFVAVGAIIILIKVYFIIKENKDTFDLRT